MRVPAVARRWLARAHGDRRRLAERALERVVELDGVVRRRRRDIYDPPARDFDTDFQQVQNLPPLTPQVVSVRQILFTENFR